MWKSKNDENSKGRKLPDKHTEAPAQVPEHRPYVSPRYPQNKILGSFSWEIDVDGSLGEKRQRTTRTTL